MSHIECVMKAGWLWEAARSGLGRSPPAGVCRLSDSSALVYHTAAAAWREEGGSAELAEAHPSCPPSSLRKALFVF